MREPTDEWLAFARGYRAKSRKQRAAALADLNTGQRESLLQAWEALGLDRAAALPDYQAAKSWVWVVPGAFLALSGLFFLLPAPGPLSAQAVAGAAILGLGLVFIGPLWRLITRSFSPTGARSLRVVLVVALLMTLVIAAPQPPNTPTPQAQASRRQSQSPPARSARQAPVTVMARDLFAAYEANEVAADRQYKGKRLMVAGAVV